MSSDVSLSLHPSFLSICYDALFTHRHMVVIYPESGMGRHRDSRRFSAAVQMASRGSLALKVIILVCINIFSCNILFFLLSYWLVRAIIGDINGCVILDILFTVYNKYPAYIGPSTAGYGG